MAETGGEFERLLAREQERRRKSEKLETLLQTIADALDIRAVFPQMSDIIQDVVPHVTVALALLTPDRLGVKIHVASNYDVGELPLYRFTTEGETIRPDWRSFIVYDATIVEDGVLRALVTPADAPVPQYTELRPNPA